MFSESEILKYCFLILAGTLAGIINTLAGGGSSLTLPALLMCGLSSPVANATNRVAILFQNITASAKFKYHNQLKVKPVLHIIIAASVGAILGSTFATRVNSVNFDKMLVIVLLFILTMILLPKRKRKTRKPVPKYIETFLFFGIGIYGGFIQVGVGFLFIGVLSLVSNNSLIKSNAIKVFIVGLYTFWALVIFIIADKIIWKYGLVLAVGNSIGAYLGVKLAIRNGEIFVKIILSIAIVFSVLKLFNELNF